ncbi:MAG: DUF3352 domain-containing protein [Chamaesiphon sp.]
MPQTKSKLLVPIISAAVVVAGGVAAYLYFNGSLGDATSPLSSAKVVPNEALMAGSISTDTKSWSQLRQFGSPETQTLIGQGLDEFKNKIFTELKIDYEKDVKPWLGNIMFAVLPSSTSNQTQKTSVLTVVGIKDKVSALNFANKLKNQKDIQPQVSEYKDIQIIETKGQSSNTYLAVLDNHLVGSSERRPVELAIDTFKGQPSFASKEGAASLLSQGVDVKNSLAQFYVPDYGSVTQQWLATTPHAPQIPPETLKQLQQVKSVAMGVGVDDVGLRMKAIAKITPSALKWEYKPVPGKVVAQFPAETIALASGQGISRFWSSLVQQSQNSLEIQQAIKDARQQVKTSVNLDLDKDIFGWMDGEFALGAISSNQGILAPLGFGGALVFKTSDRTTAEATFNKLDTFAKDHLIAVTQRDVQGKTVTEWQLPGRGALLGHGWLDGESVFVALGGPIVDAIATQPNPSLDNSETFKAVTGSLPKPNAGYFYLDMDKAMSLVNRYLVQAQNNNIPPAASTLLNSIRGIGMTTTQPDDSTSQVEMLLALKPNSAK